GGVRLLILWLDRVLLLVARLQRRGLLILRLPVLRLLVLRLPVLWLSTIGLVERPPVGIPLLILLQLLRLAGGGGFARRRAAGEHRRPPPRPHPRGVAEPFRLDQGEQRGGIGRRQPHAAVRRRRPQALHLVGAMDGVADLGEEDRVRHGRIVPFLGVVVLLHAERRIGAGGRRIAAA